MTDITLNGLRDRRIAAFDARRNTRRYTTLRAIILHSTSGPMFLNNDGPMLPPPSEDGIQNSDHRIDYIASHFVVINDGTVFYTHDVDFLSGSAGGRHGIDIEFALSPNEGDTLDGRAREAGRQLVRALCNQIHTIDHIHPHGQVQKYNGRGENRLACGQGTGVRCGKLVSCPGRDIWVSIGGWAVRHLNLTADETISYYQNNGIHQW